MLHKSHLLLVLFMMSVSLTAQIVDRKPIKLTELKQQTFSDSVPAGNYSGIVQISDNRYAVISDKSATDGFYIFRIDLDSVSGQIKNVVTDKFISSNLPNRDEEGVTFRSSDSTIYISGESDNRILQYTLYGKPTGKELNIPNIYKTCTSNYGFESLTYNEVTNTFWTANESTLPSDGQQATSINKVENIIRIQSFNDSLQPMQQFIYRMDAPMANSVASNYAMGVSELLALNDSSLLVLEREFYVPPSKLGAFVNCKLYQVWPPYSTKTLVCQFRTTLSLFNRSLANYEGMCLGPRLLDGRQTIIMISDSQNQYAGVLKDWFKVLVF